MDDENPLVEWIVSALGFVCLAALAIQTWFFIDWLMGPADWWMKYLTLCFFDIFGGIWLTLRLFHTPPSKGTYQMVGTGIVVCFLLSASTTIAWCFIFITRTPLTPEAIATMVSVARWLVVVAVLFNAFMMIFYAVETKKYHQKKKNPTKKRWATENRATSVRRPASTSVRVAQTTQVRRPVRKLPTATRKQIPSPEQEEEGDDSEEAEVFTSSDEEEDTEEIPSVPLSQRLMEAKRVLFPSGQRK